MVNIKPLRASFELHGKRELLDGAARIDEDSDEGEASGEGLLSGQASTHLMGLGSESLLLCLTDVVAGDQHGDAVEGCQVIEVACECLVVALMSELATVGDAEGTLGNVIDMQAVGRESLSNDVLDLGKGAGISGGDRFEDAVCVGHARGDVGRDTVGSFNGLVGASHVVVNDDMHLGTDASVADALEVGRAGGLGHGHGHVGRRHCDRFVG
ncbi:hypothetical protein PG993_006847 [Apiospora rasikravindrae]|uniref:Uncharacterized protein n=1 Tax=Apiospora rasikravindrae TaxID=990691 RepID=A0ABR1SX56_9PEZI